MRILMISSGPKAPGLTLQSDTTPGAAKQSLGMGITRFTKDPEAGKEGGGSSS